MSFNIEIGANIKYTDETGIYYFFEGDKIICHVGQQEYNGKLSQIGIYKENADSEPQQVICIDTLKGKTSISRDMVKVKDITYIRKNPFNHDKNIYNDEQKFVGLFMERGYNREKAESVYNRMKEAVTYYNIPVIKAAAYAMQAIGYLNNNRMCNDIENKKIKLVEFADECADMATKEYFKMLDMHVKSIEQDGLDTVSCISDTLEIVSKCWNDLRNTKEGGTESKN